MASFHKATPGLLQGRNLPAARTLTRALAIAFAAGSTPFRIKIILVGLAVPRRRGGSAFRRAPQRPSLAPPSPPSPPPPHSLAPPCYNSTAAERRPEGDGGRTYTHTNTNKSTPCWVVQTRQFA
eukprot:365889-Chlamydomonas_euryale.AAC.9